jgi:SAM-dependent methyltransferase
MPHETPQAAFWNRVARRYAAMPMRNPATWEETLARTTACLPPGAHILELGCGTGTTARRLAPHAARYIATDDAAEMIAIATERGADQPNLTLLQARPGDGSLPPGPFDAILAFNLLHLLPDRAAALREAHRLLKPGGRLITKTPCLGGRWLLLWPLLRALQLAGKLPPFRFLAPRALERQITRAGFTLVESADLPRRPPQRFLVAKKPDPLHLGPKTPGESPKATGAAPPIQKSSPPATGAEPPHF